RCTGGDRAQSPAPRPATLARPAHPRAESDRRSEDRMTRSRDSEEDTGPHVDEPQGEALEDALPLNELSSSPLLEDDDSPLPLLDAEVGPARPLAERELLLLADRIERQFAQRGRRVSWLAPRRLLLAGGLFAASAA